MKKRKIILTLLVALVVAFTCFVFTGCTAVGKNMLTTSSEGIFKYTTLTDLQKDFTLSTNSSKTASDVFTMNYSNNDTIDNTSDDTYTIGIDTEDTGWAKMAQKVTLTAGCYYKISYEITIASMSAYTSGSSYDGVYVTFSEDKDFNYYSYDEDGKAVNEDTILMQKVAQSKATFVLTFKAKESGESTIEFNVGSEKSPVNANVTLHALSLSRIKKADAVSNYAGTLSSDIYGTHSVYHLFYIVFGAIAIAVIAYIGYFMYQRHLKMISDDNMDPNSADNYKAKFPKKVSRVNIEGILLAGGIGLGIRLIINVLSTTIASTYATSIMGYNLEGLTTQAMFLSRYGMQYLSASLSTYAADLGYTVSTVVSSPLQLYVLAFCGLLGRIFESTGGAYLATMFFIRFIASLADVATMVFIFLLLRKSSGNIGATIMSVMYLIMPTVFAVSGLWGYMESVTVFLIVLTVYFMLKNNYIATAITFFVAVMFSISALWLAPFVLFYTILQCINDVKKIIPASIILVLSFFVFYTLCVPFDITAIQNGTPFNCFNRAWNELYTSMLYTRNAFNFQAMLGNNFGEISTASLIVGIVFAVFLLALAGIAYFKFKNRMNLILMATVFINMLFVFGNNMNPVSMYISLALMLIYAIMNKEKRIFFSFVAFSILMFVNVSYVELFLTYSQAGGIESMVANAVTYVFAAFEMIMSLYYIYIVYDIVVTRKVRKIKPMELTTARYFKNLGNRIQMAYYKFKIFISPKKNK